MFHSVIIASLNRPKVLGETLASLRRQTVAADQIIVSVNKSEDVPPDSGSVLVAIGPLGLTAQRNTGLAALDPRCDVISFFDDDVELDPEYCRRMRAAFEQNPDFQGLNGEIVADGTHVGGIPREKARQLVQDVATDPGNVLLVESSDSLYGCNMNVRRRVADQVRFDEKFVAYGWLEDLDFSNRVAATGRIGCVRDCRLVHLATTAGRTSGVRMGVSQIINPLYMYRKGTFNSLPRLLRRYWLPVIFANASGALLGRQSEHVDRRGRLKGNMLGVWHVLRGQIDPEMMLRY